jgi:hypothetical protein
MRRVTWLNLLSIAAISTNPFAALAGQFNELPALFDLLSPKELKAANLEARDLLQDPTVRRARFVGINDAALADLLRWTDVASAAAPVVRLNLFDDAEFNLVPERVDKCPMGIFTDEVPEPCYVIGHSASATHDRAKLFVINGDIESGEITMHGSFYLIRPAATGYAIVELKQGTFPDEFGPNRLKRRWRFLIEDPPNRAALKSAGVAR